MKKVIAIISILFLLMGCTSVYAANQVTETAQSTTGKIIEIKDKELKTLEEYINSIGSQDDEGNRFINIDLTKQKSIFKSIPL